MRRIIGGIAVVAMMLSFGGSAIADHTESCNGTITQLDTPAGTFYVDDRGIDSDGVWIYQESNGVAGLQSGGVNAVSAELGEDACYAVAPEGEPHPAPDTLLF